MRTGKRHLGQVGQIREIARCLLLGELYGKVVAIIDEILPHSRLDLFFNPGEIKQIADKASGPWYLVEGQPSMVPILNLNRRIRHNFTEDIAILQSRSPEPNTGVTNRIDRSDPEHRKRLKSGTFDFGFTNLQPLGPRTVNVGHIITREPHLIRKISLRHRIRGETEAEVYGRENLVKKFVNTKKVSSISCTSFVDAFALFGKGTSSYFSMLGVYMCPANIPLQMRLQLINQFPLVLGSMGTNLESTTDTLQQGSMSLERGLEIKIHGEPIILCAFNMAKIGMFKTPAITKLIVYIRGHASTKCQLWHTQPTFCCMLPKLPGAVQ